MILGKSPTGNTILHVLEQYKILPKYRGHDALVAAVYFVLMYGDNISEKTGIKRAWRGQGWKNPDFKRFYAGNAPDQSGKKPWFSQLF